MSFSLPKIPPFRRSWGLWALGILGSLAVLAVGALFITVLLLPLRIPESGSRQQVLFYSIATDLAPGVPMPMEQLLRSLDRLDYRPVLGEPGPGEFLVEGGSVEIHLRPFRYPEGPFPGGRIRLWIEDDVIAWIEPVDPVPVSQIRLEPERIAGYEGTTAAVLNPLELDDAPPLLLQALVAVEDRRFYQHPGVDPIGTLRALWVNLRSRETSQGGSTLTQQLARSLFLHNQKTFLRKLEEALLALRLERTYGKREILEAYLNAVYWGQWSSLEIRGVREASLYYLDRPLDQAGPAGIAMLVGLIPAPNAYSPYKSPEKALQRRDLVLRIMEQRGLITPEEAEEAKAQPLPSAAPPLRAAAAPYFLDEARREVTRRAPRGALDLPGTVVFTTLDPRYQMTAVSAVMEGLEELESSHPKLQREKSPLQAALVAVDPRNGEVRALVGGRDFLRYPYNRATRAHRQPGSLFKPFVYLTAFGHPGRGDGSKWNPGTLVVDEPFFLQSGGKTWFPQNYDKEHRGPVSLRHALEHSLNVPTAKVGVEVGIGRIAQTARDLGVRSPLQEVPALTLGASEVTLLEITGAYSALAAMGTAHPPHLLRSILGPDGEQVPLSHLAEMPGIGAPEAYLTTRILEGVIDNGTGRRARALGVKGTVAGKTGTTDEYRDAWFEGYTPHLAVGVWTGFDDNQTLGLTGAAAALPIWARMMTGTLEAQTHGGFPRPAGIVTVAIDPTTGMQATSDSPSFMMEEFIAGTEPEEPHETQKHGIISRAKSVLGF